MLSRKSRQAVLPNRKAGSARVLIRSVGIVCSRYMSVGCTAIGLRSTRAPRSRRACCAVLVTRFYCGIARASRLPLRWHQFITREPIETRVVLQHPRSRSIRSVEATMRCSAIAEAPAVQRVRRARRLLSLTSVRALDRYFLRARTLDPSTTCTSQLRRHHLVDRCRHLREARACASAAMTRPRAGLAQCSYSANMKTSDYHTCLTSSSSLGYTSLRWCQRILRARSSAARRDWALLVRAG